MTAGLLNLTFIVGVGRTSHAGESSAEWTTTRPWATVGDAGAGPSANHPNPATSATVVPR